MNIKNISLKEWLSAPTNIRASIMIVLPVIFSQLLQRLYPIIDNHYLNVLGHQALYIHSIQYNFVTFGQFIGTATVFSCLVFWRRKECTSQQGNILIKHLLVTSLLTIAIGLIAWFNSDRIMNLYHVDKEYLAVATLYLSIGLANMILQAIYISLDGMLVASQQQKYSMFIAVLLLIGNIAADNYAAYHLFLGEKNMIGITNPMLVIGLSTTGLMLFAIIVSLGLVLSRVHGWSRFSLKDMLGVWWSELGIYLIRGITPFIFAYQFCLINAGTGFLVTYQLALQLSFIFCLPLLASMQIAIREASATASETQNAPVPHWWQSLLYTGMLPSTILLSLGIFAAVPIMQIVYGYAPPVDHIEYLSIFFISCWVGQWGNVFTVPLRAKKLNYLVTKNFFISELIILLGGTQLLILLNQATPLTIGYLTLLFTLTYCLLNMRNCQTQHLIALEIAK